MTVITLPHLPPHLTHLDKRRQYRCDSVTYSKTGKLLDVWRARETKEGAPVLLWFPGGAWASASRFTMQGHALMTRLVEQGWVCCAVDYRTAPRNRWPAQIDDALYAVEWARANAERYGGDPEFVCVAGASAGGHLATLTGLQGAVDGVASLYGSYDWEGWNGWWRHVFMQYLERVVVGKRQVHHPEIYYKASPLAQVNALAAPQIILHGTWDTLISVDEARTFYKQMIATSLSAVEYHEVPRALHGFDLYDAKHCAMADKAIVDFLERVRYRPLAA